MDPGFTPPDLTHPGEWLRAASLAAQGGAWLFMALLALGLVLAALAWSTRRDGVLGPADVAVAGYAAIAGALPRALLAFAMVVVAGATCSTLANRAHHDEMRARAEVLASFPDSKMVQGVPRFGHQEVIPYMADEVVAGKPVKVRRERREERFHYVGGTNVAAKILRRPDPIHPGRDRFQVAFNGTYTLISPLPTDRMFFLDLPGPSDAALVRDLTVETGGRALAPETEGGTRYWLNVPGQGKADVTLRYTAEGVPRWVYDTAGSRLVGFTLAIETDATDARFASGVAPTKDERTGVGRKLTWAFPGNAAVAEPVGIFTAAGELGIAGLLPRWLLLAPGLLALWLGVLALVTKSDFRRMLVAGSLFAAAVFITSAIGKWTGAPVVGWLVAGFGMVLLADRLGERGLQARIGTALGLVLPGAALALPAAGPALAVALSLLAGWLAWDESTPT